MPMSFPDVVDEGWSVSRLVVFRDRLYAVGVVGGDLRVWRSDSGVGWSPIDVGDASGGTGPTTSSGRRVVVGATATAERMVVMNGAWSYAGEGAIVTWTSTDGDTMTRAVPTGLEGGLVADLSHGPAGFLVRSCLCSGPVERWLLKTSTDGITWDQAGEVPVLSYGVAYDGATQRYLAATLDIRENEDTLAALDASTDGTSWSRVTTAPGVDSNQVAVAVSGGTIVLLGSRYAPDDMGASPWSRGTRARPGLIAWFRALDGRSASRRPPSARRASCSSATAAPTLPGCLDADGLFDLSRSAGRGPGRHGPS